MDLHRRLLRALDLAGTVLSSLEPPSPLAGIVEKVAAETAMLLLCASATADDHPGIAKGVHHIARRLAPLARSDAVLATFCLQPSLARDVALAHAALSRLGHPDAAVDAMLTAALAAAGGAGPERPPHRQLEQEWIARLWPAAATGLRRVPGLAAQSMLGRPVDALTSTRDDLYAFTHAVMYLTDLGSRRVNLLRRRADITADAEAGLALSLDTDDYDLTAELLLTWTMLGLRWTPAAVFAFQCVAGVADDMGFLPGCSFQAARCADLAAGERALYRVTSSYHTGYVWGFLCASILVPGRTPAAVSPRTVGVRPGSGDALLELVAERPARWVDRVRSLAPPQRDALAPFVLNVVLRRATQAGNIALVRSALERGARWDALGGSAPKQAAALLRRAADLSLSVTASAAGHSAIASESAMTVTNVQVSCDGPAPDARSPGNTSRP